MSESVVIWKTFKFTQIRRDGVHDGWEARCYHGGHNPQGSRTGCTRTLRFSAGGGPEATERKLKCWCSRAWLHSRKSGHPREPRHPDALPSLEELEAFEPPPAHTEAMAERGGRRAFS